MVLSRDNPGFFFKPWVLCEKNVAFSWKYPNVFLGILGLDWLECGGFL